MKVIIRVPHNLCHEKAKKRIQNRIEEEGKQHGGIFVVAGTWNGYSYSFDVRVKGYDVSGIVVVRQEVVEATLNLPWIAHLFQDKIEYWKREVTKELKKLLAAN